MPGRRTALQVIGTALAVTGALVAGPAPSSAATAGPASAGAAGSAPTVRVKVLTMNIFYGGDELDLATGDFCAVPDGCTHTLDVVVDTIRRSGADVVGVQEAERNTELIASRLGWYGSNRAHVMSRFPIVDPPGSDGRYVFLQVAPGRVMAMANTHLPSDPYGPYAVRDGAPRADVLALERTVRLPAVQPLVRVLPALARRGIPVVLTGDFNSPSHLDWTPAVAKARADVPYPVPWPASAALGAAGLRDTYREAHPDPVARPGYTWTPGGPESAAPGQEVFDRIDWVLAEGPVRTVASTVVGERGNPDVGVPVPVYPTDHRGVVSTLDVRPAVPPVLVAPAVRSASIGDRVPVTFHAPGEDGEWVALLDAAGHRVASAGTGQRRDGTVTLPTTGLARSVYRVALLSGSGRTLSQTPLWLYPRSEPAKVGVSKSRYAVGEPIGVSWSRAPGMALDWVSVFRCRPSGCTGNSGYLVYDYTGNRIEGRLSLGARSVVGNATWPLRPGTYVVRLLTDDGLRSVAKSEIFTIAP
jgi:endonuclease/exonuclease/phosphatase family metal-dependent hydrolase